MKLPVPIDTQSVLKDNTVLLKTSNLGLLFNKYASVWSDDWTTEEKRGKDKVNLKSEFLDKIEKQSICAKEGKAIVDSLCKRQSMIIQGLKSSGWHVEPFNANTDSRLIIGLGGTSVIETGMMLHPLYGFPYLPGSGLKGLARGYAEIAGVASKEELHVIFGSDDKNPPLASENIQGRVFFLDGLPTTFPKLELDIMNPHYSEYYQGNKPPADYLNPVPVTFLTVAAGQTFSFVVFSRHEDLAVKARKWLTDGLTDLGAGGKTNVGYGYFKIRERSIRPPANAKPDSNSHPAVPTVTVTHQVIPLQKAEPEPDNSLPSRIKTVKNPKTFIDFIKSIKPDETDVLKNLFFKDYDVNMGYTGELESVEIAADIKQIIAHKILDITTPNKKWDEKKREKYNKLCSMAGLTDA